MRIPLVILVSALLGLLVGAAVAYVEIGSTDVIAVVQSQSGSPQSPTIASSNSAEKHPRVQVDEPHFQFGSMLRGSSMSHRFEVKNVGDAPLTLRVGQTTCKCTLGEVSGEAVPPGGTTHVLLEWKALSDYGPFRQSATLITNDPLASQLDLSIEGHITEAKNLSPTEFVLDKVAVGESKSAEVIVMAMLQDDLVVSDPKISDPATSDKFDIKIEPLDDSELPNPEAKQGVRVTLTTKPGLPVGRFHQWVSLRTNLPGSETLDIPLVGRVAGDISVHGINWNEEAGVLSLGKVKSSEGRAQRVNVVARGEGAPDVQLAVDSVDPEELKVTIGEPKKITDTLVHFPVEIQVPAGTRPMVRLGTAQGEEGRVVLKTTHPTIKELVLGVRFAVER
jgi:hypothetical protein